MLLRKIAICLSLVVFCGISVFAQPDCAGYEARKQAIIESELSTGSGDSRLVAQAYLGLPLDQQALDNILVNIVTTEAADFRISGTIMRILFFTDGEYDDQILPVLNSIPFWLPDPTGPDRQYWSENHMIMWMSSDWLLHEKYGREVRPTLRQMVVKWLDMKIEYGFYEYFSAIYYPFTLRGILNLADFAEDDEIREKAQLAATRLLSDALLMVNDQGYYFPTCGRCDMGKFSNEHVGGVGSLAQMITGLGDGTVRGNIQLATSGFDVSAVCESWTSEVNTTIHYGHPLSEARNIYSELEREDRVIFQWSSGGYFHPLTAQETMWQISNFDLWGHEEFEPFAFAQIFPPSFGNVFAKIAASITRSSYIGNVEIDIFKKDGIVLTSSQDMWKGRAGYQIYPIAATIESNPVLLRSGEIYPNWEGVPSRRSNDHLPYVDQEENVALVMYKPNWDLPIWGFGNKEVALKWQSEAFDEERAFDNWQLGRIDDSYIAVKKHCDEVINGIPACPDGDGQTWAIVVGNEEMHGSFDEFQTVIEQSFYEEKWYFNWQKLKWVYYGHIIVDGKDIDHHWLGNLWDAPENPNGREADTGGRKAQFESADVNLFPNPARDNFTLDLRAYKEKINAIYVMNDFGQNVYQQRISGENPPMEYIQTAGWPHGTYTVIIENANGSVSVKRLVVVK